MNNFFDQLELRKKTYEEIHLIYEQISSPGYQELIQEFENKLKDYLRNIFNSAIHEVTGKPTEGKKGIKISSVGSTTRLTNVPSKTDFDIEIGIFPKQTKLSLVDLGQIINRFVLSIAKENLLGDCFIRRYSNKQIESLFIETNKNLKGEIYIENIDIQIHYQYGGFKENSSAPVKIKRRIKQLCENEDETQTSEKINKLRSIVIFTKKLLSEYGCYKFNVLGKRIGIGGVGIETWLLQYDGNIEDAFKSFWNASHNEKGDLVLFEVFKKNYSIQGDFTNPNGNNKQHYFTDKILKEEGWILMLKAIESTGLHL